MIKRILPIIAICTANSCFATANSGSYIGLELGAANQSLDFQQSAFNLNSNGSNLINNQWSGIGRIFGGYNFNKYNGVEAGFSYGTGSTYNYPDGTGSMTSNTSIIDIAYIPMLPISNSNWSVFGRLGVEYAWINSSGGEGCNCSGIINPINPSGSNFADEIGAGMRYIMPPKKETPQI